MTALAFIAAARELATANGLDEETALHYMSLIGDIHEVDEAGKVIVRDDEGREVARVFLPDEEESPTFPSPLAVENARIIKRDGRHAPVITVGGRLYCIETKESLLMLGIANMQPLGADLWEDYAAPVISTAVLPADPADGRLSDGVLENFTRDPDVVALARKFHLLASGGTVKEGDLV